MKHNHNIYDKDISKHFFIFERSREITNSKGSFVNPRSINATLKTLGFKKAELKRERGNVKRVIPLNKKFLKNLFKKFDLDCNGCNGCNDSNGEPPEKQTELKIEVCNGVVALHSNRYNRYTVTDFKRKLTDFLKKNPESSFEEI